MKRSKYFNGPSGIYYNKKTNTLLILDKLEGIMWVSDSSGEKSTVYVIETSKKIHRLAMHDGHDIEYIGSL